MYIRHVCRRRHAWLKAQAITAQERAAAPVPLLRATLTHPCAFCERKAHTRAISLCLSVISCLPEQLGLQRVYFFISLLIASVSAGTGVPHLATDHCALRLSVLHFSLVILHLDILHCVKSDYFDIRGHETPISPRDFRTTQVVAELSSYPRAAPRIYQRDDE